MTTKELLRYDSIKRLLRKEINGTDAARILKISVRHVRRMKNRVKQHGAKGVVHQSRGRPGNRKIPEKKKEKIEKIVRKQYPDFGPTFAAEKLAEEHGIRISEETLRTLMISWGFWKVRSRRKNKEYHSWRKRKEHYGELGQFDGSYHHWFEDRGPECCLLASIDDATSTVDARFNSDEGVEAVFDFWEHYLTKHGKPLSIYVDRFSTYKQNAKHLSDDPKAMTQFQRALRTNLDIDIIHAYSAQAKGRVERLFKTLQDRLIKEMRLKKISTITEANRFLEKDFLPKFNKKFSVKAVKKTNFHRVLQKKERQELKRIFSIQEERTVLNDFTVRYKNNWFQLAEIQPTTVLRRNAVLIEERPNGHVSISLRGKNLIFTTLPGRPKKVHLKEVTALTRTKTTWKPPINHPWRKATLHVHKAKKKV